MVADVWAVGDAYERYMGRWSRAVAAAFVAWLDMPADKRWLDVGCGTGALSAAVLAAARPAELIGVDASENFVRRAREQSDDARAGFEVADATALPFAEARFDAVVSGLMLNFVPEPLRAVAEFARVAAPDGTSAVYVWDYAEGMEMLRRFWDAATALDPAAAALDEGDRFSVCAAEPLRALWDECGFEAVDVEAIAIPTVFRDFDDYWEPFLGGQGPAPGYVASLSEEHRTALREDLRRDLPVSADGSIALTARAWAVRGRRG